MISTKHHYHVIGDMWSSTMWSKLDLAVYEKSSRESSLQRGLGHDWGYSHQRCIAININAGFLSTSHKKHPCFCALQRGLGRQITSLWIIITVINVVKEVPSHASGSGNPSLRTMLKSILPCWEMRECSFHLGGRWCLQRGEVPQGARPWQRQHHSP